MESSQSAPGTDDGGAQPEHQSAVTLAEATRTWARVAALSFGGPAGQIAVMHRILVEEKRWINEERFLHALNYCMLLPGPEAQQLATYIGWLMHRTLGGLIAGGLFILPGSLAILALSIVYARYQQLLAVEGLFFGLKAAVMAIVVEAVLRIGRRVLKNSLLVLLSAAAFTALFAFNVPFPLVIAVAAVIGLVGSRLAPELFPSARGSHGPKSTVASSNHPPAETQREFVLTNDHLHSATGAALWRRSFVVSAICLLLWWGPLLLVREVFGGDAVYWQEGLFFSQAAVVTFGGAYAVLSYVAQQAVDHFGWLQPGEMLDGLGMAETTPGPLIMVVQFVGFLGAYRNPGPLSPLTAGILGSLVTTWATFVPCFYWIFLGAPFVERLRGNRVLSAALTSITAAVVGVILNLAVWFSLHTLFATVREWTFGPLHVPLPVWSTLDLSALAIAVVAFGLTFVWKRGMATTLAVCAVLGVIVVWLRG